MFKPFPGVFQLLQMGPNVAVFGDAIVKAPNFPDMEQTIQALFTSPVMKAVFPNVPDASMFFGQMMEKQLEEFSAIDKIAKPFIQPKTNLLTYGNDTLPGGVGSSLLGGGRGR